MIQLGGNYSVKYSTKKNDAIFKIGTGNITLKNAAETAITVVGANGTASVFGEVDSGINFNDDETAVTLNANFSGKFDVTEYSSLILIDASTSGAVNLTGNSNDNIMIGGWGDDTFTGGDGADIFVYSTGGGDDIITDYTSGEDTIQLDGALILETSYDGDDVIFNLGGGSITVKDGKDKAITITDAFGNTTSEIYSPSENSDTELTEDEILDTLHEFSQQGLEAFVEACAEINFEEMTDAAESDYEKFAIEYTQKLYDFSKELLESEIVIESIEDADIFRQSNGLITASADMDETKRITADDIRERLEDFNTFNYWADNALAVIDDFGVVSPPISTFISMYGLGLEFTASYVATDGRVWEDSDLVGKALDTIGHVIGNAKYSTILEEYQKARHFKVPADVKASKGFGNVLTGTSLAVGIGKAVVDYNSIKDNVTFKEENEKIAHAVSTFVIEGVLPIIPLWHIGLVFTLLPPDMKEHVRDLYADMFVNHKEVILDNSHTYCFAADTNSIIEIIDASSRDANHPIKIVGNARPNTIKGSAGNDTIQGGYGNNLIYGNSGNDYIYGNTYDNRLGKNTIYGGDGNDSIHGDSGDDKIYGGKGNDVIFCVAGKNIISGGSENDKIYGGTDNDLIFGGAGNDTLWGGNGDDTLYSGPDSDILIGGKGDDEIHLLDGHNVISYAEGDGDDIVYGFSETDALRITSGTSSTITSGNDKIVKVGSGSITLKGAKNLKNINFDNTAQYNGHSYAIFNVSKTWSEAKAYCEKRGGHLVTITDAGEQAAVENLLRNSTLNYSGYWLGATKSSDWQWTTGEIFGYRNFASREPNGSGNYLQIYTGNEFGKWDDTTPDGSGNAGIKQHGFICEWETENPFASINSSIIKGYSSNAAETPWFAEDDNFISGADLDSILDSSAAAITDFSPESFDSASILNLAQTDSSFQSQQKK